MANNDFASKGYEAVDITTSLTGADPFAQKGYESQGLSLGQAASTVGEGAAGGAASMGGIAAGAMTGATLGAAGGPVGAVVGGLAGATAGYFAGESFKKGAGIRTPEQMTPQERPFGFGGESLGGSAFGAAMPFAAAASGFRFGASAVGNFLNQIINTAKTSPWLTGLTEGAVAASSASAAGVAEAMAPGKTMTRISAEVTAGVLNPASLAAAGGKMALNLGRKGLEGLSPAARETSAGRAILDVFAQTGEDPLLAQRLLRSTGVLDGVPQTAAQKAGTDALAGLQSHLSTASPRFAAEAKAQADAANDVIRGQIALLARTGDPAALKTVAELRSTQYKMLIKGRLDAATNDALAAAGNISKDTQGAREGLSIAAGKALDSSITDVRKAETALWDVVDGTRKVETATLESTLDTIKTDLLVEVRGEKIPTVVRNFLNRVTAKSEGEFVYDPVTMVHGTTSGDAVGTSVKEMRQLRSELLDMARGSTITGDFGQARIYNDLAEAVLDDMDIAFKAAGDTSYDAARSFSRELNDVFTRSFAGKAVGQGKYGDRIAPEILLRKALATGKEAGELQMRELEEATRFMVTRGIGDDDSLNIMLDAQERTLRLTAALSIDPKTNRVSTGRLLEILRDNEKLLNRFPEVRTDIQAAIKSDDALSRMTALATRQVDVTMKQKAFSKLALDGADPVTIASKALLSNNMEAEIVSLAKLARGGGKDAARGVAVVTAKEALSGLRASLMNAAIQRSTNRDGVLQLSELHAKLFIPSVQGGKTAARVMVENGIMDQSHLKNMEDLFKAADRIVQSGKPGTKIDVKTDFTDAVLSFMTRVFGAEMARTGARAAGSTAPSIQVSGAGARFAEMAVTKIPTQRTRDLLVSVLNDPIMTADLMQKASTMSPRVQLEQSRRIHAWLVQSGLTYAEETFRMDISGTSTSDQTTMQQR